MIAITEKIMPSILFIDDEARTLELMHDLYGPYNQVYTARNEDEALTRLNGAAIEIVVVDILLKESENGCDVAHSISKKFPHLKIYLMTAHNPHTADLPELRFSILNKADLVMSVDQCDVAQSFEKFAKKAF